MFRELIFLFEVGDCWSWDLFDFRVCVFFVVFRGYLFVGRNEVILSDFYIFAVFRRFCGSKVVCCLGNRI